MKVVALIGLCAIMNLILYSPVYSCYAYDQCPVQDYQRDRFEEKFCSVYDFILEKQLKNIHDLINLVDGFEASLKAYREFAHNEIRKAQMKFVICCLCLFVVAVSCLVKICAI